MKTSDRMSEVDAWLNAHAARIAAHGFKVFPSEGWDIKSVKGGYVDLEGERVWARVTVFWNGLADLQASEARDSAQIFHWSEREPSAPELDEWLAAVVAATVR